MRVPAASRKLECCPAKRLGPRSGRYRGHVSNPLTPTTFPPRPVPMDPNPTVPGPLVPHVRAPTPNTPPDQTLRPPPRNPNCLPDLKNSDHATAIGSPQRLHVNGMASGRATLPEMMMAGGEEGRAGSEGIILAWPRFEIALSSKEKEEDFMIFKGCSKLPLRPKKRAKCIQRTVNLVCPGTWLCDLTQERYEVREKKISKKRPRGLKAMGSVESNSD